jgi:hypothetical protein
MRDLLMKFVDNLPKINRTGILVCIYILSFDRMFDFMGFWCVPFYYLGGWYIGEFLAWIWR